MSGVTDSNDNIGGLEKINTLWKQYNNLINTKPSSYASGEEVPFNNYIINNDIFNEDVPENIFINNDTILNIILPNNETVEFIITPNDFSLNSNYLSIKILDNLFDQSDNILIGSKCNFENLGYKHIEFYYKKECYPTIYNSTDQLYTWFIPEPSNGSISSNETNNLLKNTIAYLYDPYNNTYKYQLFYKLGTSFYTINFATNPDFAYLDNKSGFLYFYGGTRIGNNVTLANIRSQRDSNPSPPYMSYIRYNGNLGFNNLSLTGNVTIDSSLSIINDDVFSDISNLNYNVLNTQQIRQYVENLNILGGSGNSNSLSNYENKVIFDLSNILTETSDIQDLSAIFFNTITPSSITSKILINLKTTLYCSYALEERINVELWRDLSMISQDNNIGSVIATGGLSIPYNFIYLDEPNNNNLVKYYLKYKLENNNSKEKMGIINIQSNNISGSSNIILREL
tara:strand:- start:480 stop:1847 length:1368 start_codon:yes stop_codon:yes gene_type:complete